jgi:hypothetical protein
MSVDRRPCRVSLVGGMAGPARLRVSCPDGYKFLDGSNEKVFGSITEAIETISGERLTQYDDD